MLRGEDKNIPGLVRLVEPLLTPLLLLLRSCRLEYWITFLFKLKSKNVIKIPHASDPEFGAPMTEYEARDFLKPLLIGSHTIYFKGELRSITATGSNQTFAGPYG